MNMLPTYLQLGFEHITDLHGYDHMLFLLALCAAYVYTDWKKILVLVTAFTIGHSITLALAVLNVIPVNSAWIEFLIPVTIVATAAKNLIAKQENATIATYFMALGFGLIHGMGFSNYLRSLLGDELLMPLFAFNIGIELGQLLVVSLIFSLQFALISSISVKHDHWNKAISILSGGISLLLAAQRIPF
ncbi:MAG: HupE/UreJ family protein [Flavobacteriales bacterium]|nr:HupE/UreJ family protein [Flavobacteriales bacterium]